MGVVLDLMIHDLDVILHFVKSKVERVDAVGVPILSEHEDIANARLTFANGAVANVTASRVAVQTMRKIRVFSPDSYISLDYTKRQGVIFRKAPKLTLDVEHHIPDDYVADVGLRLSFYKRFAAAPDEEAVLELAAELEDRFGKPPEPVLQLSAVMALRSSFSGR